jgi:hypothetical protein
MLGKQNHVFCRFRVPAEGTKDEKYVVRPLVDSKAAAKPKNKNKPSGGKGGKKDHKYSKHGRQQPPPPPPPSRRLVVEEEEEEEPVPSYDTTPLLDPLALLADVAHRLAWKALKATVACFEFSPPDEFFPDGRIRRKAGVAAAGSLVRFSRDDFPEHKVRSPTL